MADTQDVRMAANENMGLVRGDTGPNGMRQTSGNPPNMGHPNSALSTLGMNVFGGFPAHCTVVNIPVDGHQRPTLPEVIEDIQGANVSGMPNFIDGPRMGSNRLVHMSVGVGQ